MMPKILLVLFLLIAPNYTKADLYPNYLKLKLTCLKDSFSKDDLVQFNLSFINTHHKSHTILVPGTMHNGLQLFQFYFFTVKENHYTEVYRESRVVNMDKDLVGNSNFKVLNPNEETMVPLFINDQKNASRHIDAHHTMPNLPPGEYKVLVRYLPWQDSLSKYIFQPIPDFEEPLNLDTNKLNLPTDGLVSNYVSVTISSKKHTEPKFLPNKYCSLNCIYCSAIENENWQKVAQLIRKQTYYYKGKHENTDSNWRMPHRAVASLSEGPDAILSSLPTATFRKIIFKTANGYHYFYAKWQIGQVYPGKARFNFYTRKLKMGWLKLKSEEIDYCKLIKLQAY